MGMGHLLSGCWREEVNFSFFFLFFLFFCSFFFFWCFAAKLVVGCTDTFLLTSRGIVEKHW